MTIKPVMRRSIMLAVAIALASCAGTPAQYSAAESTKSISTGATWTVNATTTLNSLTIAQGAQLVAPAGKSLTMTVNGIETGIVPGVYAGKVVLTVADEYAMSFGGMGTTRIHPFRQALYLDKNGVTNQSVPVAAGNYKLDGNVLTGVNIQSKGENFNGIVVTGGSYVIKGASIDMEGNGGNDFAGWGSAVLSLNAGTTLVLDEVKIRNRGVIRTAAVADEGSQLIVKNSELETREGVLPADYVSNVSPGDMKDVPWMLGLSGNVRTTNLLGENTTATYINSSIASTGWGVLSVDGSKNAKLTTINSKVNILGKSGYGSYAIGDSLNRFYGTEFNVPDYAVIITGGHAVFAASTPENVAQLNTDLKLGLTSSELKALARKPTTVKSGRFGVMWHGNGTVNVADDTVINTQETTFLVKGAQAKITVDGAKGARLNTGNGVLVQVMDNDDPGAGMVNGKQVNNGIYNEPTGAVAKVDSFDIAAENSVDVVVNLANIDLQGSLYNATRGGARAGMGAGAQPAGAAGPGVLSGNAAAGSPPGGAAGGAPGGAAGGPPGGGAGGPPAGGGPGGGSAGGRNLIVNLDHASLAGAISSSSARHAKSTITSADYQLLGEVTNTPSAAVNNGVQVALSNSTWTVTGMSYLSKLTIGADSKVVAPKGYKLIMTVDGVPKAIQRGIYQGQVVLSVDKG